MTQPLSPDRQSVVMVPASLQRECPDRDHHLPRSRRSSESLKPMRHFNDQLSFLDDILEDKDVSIHKKLDKVLENQKVLFKLIADFMKRGREHVCKDFSQRLGDVSHTREREVGEGIEGCSVGSRSRIYGDVSNVFGESNYVLAPEDISNTGTNYVSRDQLGGNSQHRALEDISNATGGTSTGPHYVSGDQLGDNSQHRALEDISNTTGGTSTGTNYVSMDIPGGNNQHRETNFSREHSFEEEGGQFIAEVLVLKCASCSVGEFRCKVFKCGFQAGGIS